MADTNMPDGTAPIENARQPDAGAVVPRIKLSETGFVGLKTTNGYIIEEPNRAFRYPAMLKVVDEMRLCPSVATALSAYRLLMSSAEWEVEAPIGATQQQIERAKFIKECMHDMEHSWQSTVGSWFDYLEYGSHVSEKVFRRRLRKNGSKFDDGLVGLKKLAPRSRSSIQRWSFSDDGRELLGVEQTLRYMDKSYLYQDQLDDRGLIYIPREKFLLFTCDGSINNPEGSSILKAIYLAYKQLTLLQDQELLSVAKNIQGILKITAPPRYFDLNASADDKAVLEGYKAIINNYNNGTQRGLLVPALVDGETKQHMFTYDLMESKGQPIDIGPIIKRLQGDILTALSCDSLKMGSDSSGSFSKQDSTTNILTLAVSYRLKEIADVLNSDLVPTLYALNGWTDTELPKIKSKDISSVSMDEFGKLIQRAASVGMMPVTRATVNRVLEVAGMEQEPSDKEIDPTEMSGYESKSGKGMTSPVGDGTRTDAFNNKDSSTQNADNAS
jgi:hypothetical protein